jgi:hypothetical protein
MNGPFARLFFDSAGNLYRTTVQGGAVAPFDGTVFELMPKAGLDGESALARATTGFSPTVAWSAMDRAISTARLS